MIYFIARRIIREVEERLPKLISTNGHGVNFEGHDYGYTYGRPSSQPTLYVNQGLN